MRELRESGDGLLLKVDMPDELLTLRDNVKVQVLEIKSRYADWNTYTQRIQDAIIILEMSKDAIEADWQSSLFRTKIITAVLLGELRAHEKGGYQLKTLVWTLCKGSFSDLTIERLELATKMAFCMLQESTAIQGHA